jgi:ParB family transcriptional regulator, chromosome partitioning protein
MPRNALGRGLSALIREPEPLPQPLQEVPPPAPGTLPQGQPAASQNEGLLHVDIDLIDPSPYQPRTRFREQSLEELAQSIRSSGIVQPLVVRRVGHRYQLIAGERRWRAAQRAALSRVPVVVRDVPEERAVEMTLVENLQREDLNPIEQGQAFERLIQEFALTQEDVAQRTGKDRATIANAVRLLKLEPQIRDLIEEGRVSAGHGRAILSIADPKARLEIARRVARGGMTVRQVERLASRAAHPKPAAPAPTVDPNTKAAIDELQTRFGTRVILHPLRPGHPGQLAFEYYNSEDLVRLYDRLMRE